jgi:hypothetical protein
MLKGKTPVNLCCLFYIDIWREAKGTEGFQDILPEGHGREKNTWCDKRDVNVTGADGQFNKLS